MTTTNREPRERRETAVPGAFALFARFAVQRGAMHG